jgi:hypothetical protein
MLEPSSQDLLRGASILNHRCGAFSVEPPSWCLLRKALIQNKHQAFVCDLHFGPSSEAFVLGLRPRPSIQAFVWDLCPEPLSRTFSGWAFVVDLLWSGLRHETFSIRAFIADLLRPTFFRRPSPADLLWETFSRRPSPRDLLRLAFTKSPPPLNPVRDTCPNIGAHRTRHK